MLPNFIKQEINAFNVFTHNAKRLILANLLYAISSPFLIIFTSAFIIRVTEGNNVWAVSYNISSFTGLILGYFITGFFLKKNIHLKFLFSIGLLFTVVPVTLLIIFYNLKLLEILIYGLFFGIGGGIYWSCRNFLSYLVTNDQNRNLFMGTEQLIVILCNALVPLLFGTLILGNALNDAHKIEVYKYTSIVVLFINSVAAFIVIKGKYQSPKVQKIYSFRYPKVWHYQRVLTFLIGMIDTGFMALLVLLILDFAGDESVLGKIEFISSFFSATTIYTLSRIAKPHHRHKIMLFGVLLIIAGASVVFFSLQNQNHLLEWITFSFAGIIFLKISHVIAHPLIQTAFRATFLTSIDCARRQSEKESYPFLVDNEFFLNLGRLSGLLLFIFITQYSDDAFSFKSSFIIIGTAQLISVYLIRKLNALHLK